MSAPRAYVFDLYGTLADYAALAARFAGVAPDPDAVVVAWRQKQLAYSFAATLMDRYVDFDAVTDAALRYTCALYGIVVDAPQHDDLVAAWSALPLFPDALATLATLRERGAATAILSNGSPRSLAAAVAASGLEPLLDAVLSVDAVRAFKPRPDVYALATRRFDCAPRELVFVSSNGWDATGAAEFGCEVVWCNRAGLPAETLGAPPARMIRTLADLLA